MVKLMKNIFAGFIPFLIGLVVAALLHFTVGWWGFWVLFPWIGLSITVGNRIGAALPRSKRGVGRRIAMIMILPSLPEPYGPYGTKAWGEIAHGPHTHKYPELFIHLGTDPDNPMDLGAEVEMHAGPEMEKHIITQSTIMYMPANFVHGPWRVLNVTRPFLVITINQSPSHTEKALRHMIPEKDWSRYIFMDMGYEDEGIENKFDWPEAAGPETRYI